MRPYLTPELEAQARERLAEEQAQVCADFQVHGTADIRQRGRDLFAVLHGLAWKMAAFENDECVMFPVLLDGQFWQAEPQDEGASGFLHAYWNKAKRRWGFCWVDWGWLYEKELDLSAAEIDERLLEEALVSLGWWALLELPAEPARA